MNFQNKSSRNLTGVFVKAEKSGSEWSFIKWFSEQPSMETVLYFHTQMLQHRSLESSAQMETVGAPPGRPDESQHERLRLRHDSTLKFWTGFCVKGESSSHDWLPFHKVRASSWCSFGWPNLLDPPVDHFKALDTNAALSGEFWSIRLNSLARCSAPTEEIPHETKTFLLFCLFLRSTHLIFHLPL